MEKRKGPWGSPEVIRLDAQLGIINDIRMQVHNRLKGAISYEIIEGPRNAPEIAFAEEGGTGWEALVKTVEDIAQHAATFARTHQLGTLTIDKDDARKTIRLKMRA